MRTERLAAVLILLLCLQPAGVLAKPDAASPYRLQLANPATYRLKAAVPPAPTFDLPYTHEVHAAAATSGIDAALLHALISVESAHRPQAVSPKGARGLMQLMPATAQRYGVRDAFDPVQNLRGGSAYLRDLLVMFDGALDLALAAYNAGEGAVLRHGRKIPPYAETQHYVPRVMAAYAQLRRTAAPPPSPYRLRGDTAIKEL